MPDPVTCDICGQVRLGEHGTYSPLQVIMGQPLGWSSSSDGEVCPECLAKLMGQANRTSYEHQGPGSS